MPMPILGKRVGGQTYYKKRRLLRFVFGISKPCNFQKHCQRRDSGRCLRGMLYPLCTLFQTGECAGLLYTHRRGLLRYLFTVLGFARASKANKYGYRFPAFFLLCG